MPDPERALQFSMPGIPQGGADFFLTRLSGLEEISQLYHFQVEVVSEHAFLSSDLIRQNAVIKIDDRTSEPRYINGYVCRFEELGKDSQYYSYELEVVPRLWFLTQTGNYEVYQDKTALEIIQDKLDRQPPLPSHGSSHIATLDGPRDMTQRSYCTQYGESDFEFIARLMAEEGMYYYFEHGRDTNGFKVTSGPPFNYEPCPDQPTVRYHRSQGGNINEGVIGSIQRVRNFHPGKINATDYHYQKSKIPFVANQVVTGSNDVANYSSFERYDYPGRFAKMYAGFEAGRDESGVGDVQQQVQRDATMRMEEEEVRNLILNGDSDSPHLTSGYKFELTDYPDADFEENFNGEYLLTSIYHNATGTRPHSGQGPVFTYSNSFYCIPAERPFRPLRVTKKPIIHGPQTAIVVGPEGEEIYTDKYGRVKVQFHWETMGTNDENSSCWVRVAQAMAGTQWGTHYWPRIGHEVLVSFLNGDPDQPLIVGSVYNYDNQQPYDLPQNQTQSGIKTRSSPNGGPNDFNELRFEDKKDEEQIYIHAEKSLDTVVESDRTETIGSTDKLIVKGSRSQEIGKEGETTDDLIDVLRVWGMRQEQIEDDYFVAVLGDRGLATQIYHGDCVLSVDEGDQRTEINAGKYETTAMQSIEFKVGSNSIKIDQTGITLKGTMIKIEGEAMTEIKGATTKIQGSALVEIKGGLVKIN